MKPLTPDDLLSLDEYIARRSELLTAQGRYLDRYRRIRVGPSLTLIFENRQTLWFRVQEVIRVARLVEPARIAGELAVFNQLLPAKGIIQAALMIEVVEGAEGAGSLAFWRDLAGEHVRFVVGDEAIPARFVTARPEDRCFGTAHWLEFPMPQELRKKLSEPQQPANILIEYKTYQHQSPQLSAGHRKSLLDDLTLSDRAA